MAISPASSASTTIFVGETATLALDGTTIGKAVTLDPRGSWGKTCRLASWGNRGDDEIKGLFSYTMGNAYVSMYSNGGHFGKLTFSGGCESKGYLYLELNGGGSGNAGYSTLVVTNKPFVSNIELYLIPGAMNKDGIAYKLRFDVAGNKLPCLGYITKGSANYHLRCCELLTTVDSAFDNPSMRVYADYDFLWDLCGTSQQVGHLDTFAAAGHRPPTFTGTSEEMSTLTFTQTGDSTFVGVFDGRLNVVMNGSGTLSVNAPMTSSGTVEVKGGTLSLGAACTWETAQEIVVLGEGRISAVNSMIFGRESTIRLASSDSLVLAEGCRARAGKLVIGETEYTTGEFAFGAGTLSVGPSGFSVIIR